MPNLLIATGTQATSGFTDASYLLTSVSPPVLNCLKDVTIVRDFQGIPPTAVASIDFNVYAATGVLSFLVDVSDDGVTWTSVTPSVTTAPIPPLG